MAIIFIRNGSEEGFCPKLIVTENGGQWKVNRASEKKFKPKGTIYPCPRSRRVCALPYSHSHSSSSSCSLLGRWSFRLFRCPSVSLPASDLRRKRRRRLCLFARSLLPHTRKTLAGHPISRPPPPSLTHEIPYPSPLQPTSPVLTHVST